MLWLGRVTTNFGGVDVVPAMVGEGEGDDQLWGSGRGAIAELQWGGRATNFGGVDVVRHC